MEDKAVQLPWEALKHTEGDIPWPALYKFAAAVTVDPPVVDELLELYAGEDSREYEDPERWSQELAGRFTESEAAGKLEPELFEDAGFIIYNLLVYAWT